MVASRQAEDVVERIVWDRYRVHGVQRAAKKCNLFEFMESNVLQKNEIPNLLETKFQWSPKFKSVVLLYALYGQCVMKSLAYSSSRIFDYFSVIVWKWGLPFWHQDAQNWIEFVIPPVSDFFFYCILRRKISTKNVEYWHIKQQSMILMYKKCTKRL